MTDTVLVREDVEMEPGVILVTSLRIAARSSLVVGRAGFLLDVGSEGVVGVVVVLVILVRPVLVVEEEEVEEGATGDLVEVREEETEGAGKGREGALVVVFIEEEDKEEVEGAVVTHCVSAAASLWAFVNTGLFETPDVLCPALLPAKETPVVESGSICPR